MSEIPAVHFEGVKYAYRQSKDGIVVSFVVHPHEVPASLSTSNIGARYMVALVEIGDDEQPKKPAKVKPAKPEATEKDKKNWRDMKPAQQAGIRCAEPIFWQYLLEQHKELIGGKPHNAEQCAADVRSLCGVQSRSELNTNHAARVLWHQLDEGFQAWKALEHA